MGHRNKVTHSEAWWEMLAPPTAVRCEGHYKTGKRCKREAIPGANVCAHHGGAAPHVRAVAAARIGNAADEMVKRLQAMLDDPAVEARDKIKIAQDLLDRAGLNATEKHIIGVGEIDPVERLFRDIHALPDHGLAPLTVQTGYDPEIAALNRGADPQALLDDPDDVVEAEVIEDDPHTVRVEESMSSRPPAHIAKALRDLL